MEDVLRTLRTESLNNIVVRDEETESDEHFCIQQTILESASAHFSETIDQEREAGVKQVTLHYPQDHVSAWKTLLYWIVQDKLPEDDELSDMATSDGYPIQVFLVRCWVLGDRWGMSSFQNDIMQHIIDDTMSSGPYGSFCTEAMQEAVEGTPRNSALRKLVAADVAGQLDDPTASLADDLDSLFNGQSFMGEVARAIKHRYSMSEEQRDDWEPNFNDFMAQPKIERSRKRRRAPEESEYEDDEDMIPKKKEKKAVMVKEELDDEFS
ncbi:hypothetical protein LTR15_000688 [Elasticomyces elasticus]|nr:hypothetical protein LTR15_000688 [Elasticomyces elasticus]